MRKWLLKISLLCLTLLVTACASSDPKPKEQQKLDLTLVSQAKVNKDVQGRASPLLVKVYELKSEAAFEAADFFTLQKNDKEVLQADLLEKNEYILKPGDTKRITRKSNSQTTVLGFIAEFRDLPRSIWRVTYKLQPSPEAAWYRSVIPSKKAKLRIEYDDNEIKVIDLEAK
ncbi:type VI secretion system lipoprotein TssJ [Hydromonas duriensis]|uniref:Type VI secretion system protein VasD n=1 Tax=Hydromonas duriensis TaxID=1527608 RepID=A0A4R6Y9G7_9BURK|nr:type VI secretion system lipoprotein TssJ [Hydromonas duriensis]TDR32125.1 type VI secretion system protein VasD [Hydromonas duriensis]